MVSTRQSSSVASSSSADAYGASGSGTLFNPGGKLLRSGPVASAPPPPTQDLPVAHVTQTAPQSLLDMPMEVLEKIFSYLGYKQVAHLRPVSNGRKAIRLPLLALNESLQWPSVVHWSGTEVLVGTYQ